jgi:aspartyl-tRNA(Asn)/glutamyl-tRNA(Gln) amidotransferase subunit B
MKSDHKHNYDVTIGIECHVQLNTKTKLFSGTSNDSRDQEQNSVVSPIDYGLPGMLPVLNYSAVELAIKAAKALNSGIARVSRFDRKHYFYPDLPKGYQITQMYQPIIGKGKIDIPLEDGSSVEVRVHHAHLEEDAGKLTHSEGYSLVDLNRVGTPLIEIVLEPDLHSAAEAKACASELYKLMTYSGVTLGDLYHGNMRFDVNVSVAKKDASRLGTRAEVKNLNSFKSVERAVEYEFKRQVDRLESGEKIAQETRGWDDAKQKTISQRSKEQAQDYRYMPDPDIPPVVLEDEEIAKHQKDIPKLPPFYRQKWQKLDLDGSVVNALLADQNYAILITKIQDEAGEQVARRVSHWFASAVDTEDQDKTQEAINLAPEGFIELAQMVDNKELSSTAAKEVFNELLISDKSPKQVADDKNLLQVSDESAVAEIVEAVLADPASQKSIEDLKAGKDKAIGYLVGLVMQKSRGQANPALAQHIIRQKLELI